MRAEQQEIQVMQEIKHESPAGESTSAIAEQNIRTAMRDGDYEAFMKWIDRGSMPDSITWGDAVLGGNLRIIEWLRAHPIQIPEQADLNGKTLFHLAAEGKSDNPALIEYLVKMAQALYSDSDSDSGSDSDFNGTSLELTRDSTATALHVAAQYKKLNLFKHWLKLISPNSLATMTAQVGEQQLTPLGVAVQSGDIEATRTLLNAENSVLDKPIMKADIRTALSIAVKASNVDMFNILMNYAESITEENIATFFYGTSSEEPLLLTAAQCSNPAIFERISNLWIADPDFDFDDQVTNDNENILDKVADNTPEMQAAVLAFWKKHLQHLSIENASSLCHLTYQRHGEEGLSSLINEMGPQSNKALHNMIEKGDTFFLSTVLKLLIERERFDIAMHDSRGNTALHVAVKLGDFVSAKHLIQAGFDPMLPDNNGATALHIAVESDDENMLNYLVKTHPSAVFEQINRYEALMQMRNEHSLAHREAHRLFTRLDSFYKAYLRQTHAASQISLATAEASVITPFPSEIMELITQLAEPDLEEASSVLKNFYRYSDCVKAQIDTDLSQILAPLLQFLDRPNRSPQQKNAGMLLSNLMLGENLSIARLKQQVEACYRTAQKMSATSEEKKTDVFEDSRERGTSENPDQQAFLLALETVLQNIADTPATCAKTDFFKHPIRLMVPDSEMTNANNPTVSMGTGPG